MHGHAEWINGLTAAWAGPDNYSTSCTNILSLLYMYNILKCMASIMPEITNCMQFD